MKPKSDIWHKKSRTAKLHTLSHLVTVECTTPIQLLIEIMITLYMPT